VSFSPAGPNEVIMKVVSLARGHAPSASRVEADSALDLEIDRVLEGDELAWHRLMGRCHDLALALCRRRRFTGDLDQRDDLHRDVAQQALERMRAGDFAGLRRYAAARRRHPETRFIHWLAAVVNNTYIDVLRALPEYQRRRQAAARALVRLEVRPLDGEVGDLAGHDPAAAAEVRRILAAVVAADFPAEQRRALLLWLEGNNSAEIAEELGLAGPKETTRLLHAARERLRRRFRSI
jgi:RNA polymerase sigma factor (sigma-70 family)